MSNSGAVTLGDVAGKLAMLDVACSKCERLGRLSIAKLIAQHGAEYAAFGCRFGRVRVPIKWS